MTSIRRLTHADAERLPWKNGRGETAQIALWPPSSRFARGDFDWRVSRAAVTEPGPFSAFPGFDRVLVIVDESGLDLRHGEAAPPAHVRAWQPYRFAGDWETTATLTSGPVRDFNVFTRRARVSARVRVVVGVGEAAGEPLAVAGEHVLVHVIHGGVESEVGEGGGRFALGPFDTLWLSGCTAGIPLALAAVDPTTTRLVIVELHENALVP